MVIIYGAGTHLDDILSERFVPKKEIEAIIDNSQAFSFSDSDIRVITWDEYVVNASKFSADTIVIGGKARYDEIFSLVKRSSLFEEDHILYIDDWVQRFNRKNDDLGLYIQSKKREWLVNKISSVGEIKNDLLREAVLLATRGDALKMIPAGGVCCEVGVAFGDFSEQILQTIHPLNFYAIDMFSDKTPGFWGDMRFRDNQLTHEEYYRRRFSSGISEGRVRLLKGISWDVIQKLENDSIDYAYVDAAHDYDSVRKDISSLYSKMKEGGIMQFNDYTFLDNYGVIPAVNEFINKTSSSVVLYCLSKVGFYDIGVRVNKRKTYELI